MAKIISLQDIKYNPCSGNKKTDFEELISYAIEMSNILQLIEQSLENTSTYASKDLNSRG